MEKPKEYRHIDDKGNRIEIVREETITVTDAKGNQKEIVRKRTRTVNEAIKDEKEAIEEEKKWHRTHMSGGDCPMCGNSMFPLKRELPFEDECNKCKYSFTFVYKKINLGHTQYEDGIKPTRPKPPRAKSTGREPIPQDLMDAVWNRDGGHCVRCNSEQDLEYDHMIPLSKGGSNSYKNLQLLCRKCNRDKSDNIG